MPEKFYTIMQVTEMFGVTRTTVYEWMNAGRLQYVTVGARRRVTQTQIDAFVQGASPEPKQEVTQKNEAPQQQLAFA